METKQKKTKSTKESTKKTKTTRPNDIATDTTTNPLDAAPAVAAGSIPQPSGTKAEAEMLIAQGGTSLRLAAIYSVALAARNYTERDIQELRDNLASFSKTYTTNLEVRKAAKEAAIAYQAIVQEQLKFRDELVAGLRVATQGKPNPFQARKLMLSRTTEPKKLATWYRAAEVEVRANEAVLKAQFGEDPIALLAARQAALDDANAAHSVSRRGLPMATQTQLAARVKLATSIAKLRLVAEMAFPRNQEVLKEFVPVWSRKRRPSKKISAAPPGSGDSTSAADASAEVGSRSKPTEAAAAKPAAPADAKTMS